MRSRAVRASTAKRLLIKEIEMSAIIGKVPANLKKASKSEKSGNIFTPAVRIKWANLFTPVPPSEDEKDESKFVWTVTALVPAGFDLKAIEDEVDRLVNDKIKPANETLRRKLKLPVLETAGINSLASLADDYPFCLRLSAKAFDKNGRARQAPGVVDATGKEVTAAMDAEQCYDGRWARVSVNPFNWEHPTGGKGVSLGLVNVQLLWNDDPLAGGKVKASSEFEAVDEGDLADTAEEFA